jgi:adenosine kinase
MIAVCGSLAFDYIMNFPGYFRDHILPEKIHILNLSFKTEKLNKNFGGSAGNIAYNLALLKSKPLILASAGKDFASYRKFLKSHGIETKYIRIYKNKFSSNYFGIVDQTDNQLGGFYAGAMTKDIKLSLRQVKEKIDFAVIAATEPLAMANFTLECKKYRVPYLFDPGKALPRMTKTQLLRGIIGAEILIANDYEVTLILKKSGLSKKQLLNKTKILITTLAEKGSLIETKKELIKVKAARIRRVVDPIGAGDAYQAGFVFGYHKNYNLKTAGQLGSVCAAYTVEEYGTTTHKFTKKEFCDRYKRNFHKKLKL